MAKFMVTITIDSETHGYELIEAESVKDATKMIEEKLEDDTKSVTIPDFREGLEGEIFGYKVYLKSQIKEIVIHPHQPEGTGITAGWAVY